MSIPFKHPLAFIYHSTACQDSCGTGYPSKLNIFAVSLGECRPNPKPGEFHTILYAFPNSEYLPDIPGVYGFSANATTYSIVWSDPSGAVSSEPIDWANLEHLERYVTSLYRLEKKPLSLGSNCYLSHSTCSFWDFQAKGSRRVTC